MGHARRAGQVGAGHALLEGLGMARLQGEAGHALHGISVKIIVTGGISVLMFILYRRTRGALGTRRRDTLARETHRWWGMGTHFLVATRTTHTRGRWVTPSWWGRGTHSRQTRSV